MMRNHKKNLSNLPAISTASLPDIVFILLFFFMTVTTIKNQNLLVENELPVANETEKLDKTDRIIEIFVGQSKLIGSGKQDIIQIQIEDFLVQQNEIGHYIIQALNNIPEHLRKKIIVSIKADKRVKMGVITDIKRELRKVNMLKVNYTTLEGNVFTNQNG